MLRDADERLKDSEQHASDKERELAELLNRMKEYESGDYQLQQAVDEIKGLKGQIKVRDRDIENLIKNLNNLDFTLNGILEENDELRARLGMDPREKLDLEDLNNLKAVRAQESRAVMHVLKREIESLEEERNKLKMTIRKLARQLGTKDTVASIIDEEYFYNEPKQQEQAQQPVQQVIQANPQPVRNSKEEAMLRKHNEQLMQICLEFENDNKKLEKGLQEIHSEIANINKQGGLASNKGKLGGGSKEIKCPTLDKLLSEMEQNRTIRSSMKSYAFLGMVEGNANGKFSSNYIKYIRINVFSTY